MESLTTFLTRNVDPVHAAVISGAVFLAAATKYGPQMLVSTDIETGTLMKAEYSFEDGVIQPHKEYLYGYSSAGNYHIIGKKIIGYDYSAWEAEYESFERVRAVTFADSGAKATWSWSVKAPEAFITFNILQLMCWLVLACVCAFILGYLTRKVVCKLCHKNRNGKKESLAMPNVGINTEYWKLNSIWQRTLINMYREQKRELLSLSKLAVYYYDSSRELKKALVKESKKKGEVKLETERLKAEHAFQTAQYQREIKALQSELESAKKAKDHAEASFKEQDEKSLASYNENTDPELGDKVSDGEHGIAEVADTGDENIECAIEQEEKSAVLEDQSATPGSADNIPEVADVVEVANLGDEYVKSTQDEDVSAPHNQSAGSQTGDNVLEGGHGMAEAADAGDKNVEGTTEQDANSPASVDQVDGVKLGASGKPLRIRKNRRADGTVRTPYHPDYVPRVPDGPALGDRPAPGAGRGNGNGGGNSPGRGRGGNRGHGGDGGNRGGHFGWRGGRGGGGGRGWQGNGGGRGQFGQGRGG